MPSGNRRVWQEKYKTRAAGPGVKQHIHAAPEDVNEVQMLSPSTTCKMKIAQGS